MCCNSIRLHVYTNNELMLKEGCTHGFQMVKN